MSQAISDSLNYTLPLSLSLFFYSIMTIFYSGAVQGSKEGQGLYRVTDVLEFTPGSGWSKTYRACSSPMLGCRGMAGDQLGWQLSRPTLEEAREGPGNLHGWCLPTLCSPWAVCWALSGYRSGKISSGAFPPGGHLPHLSHGEA